ncbi:MAG: hypothetical protein ACI4QJ_07105 [Candidatus Spyradenecus sp.]
MKKSILLACLVLCFYGVAFSIIVGLPMFLTRKNKTFELRKEVISQNDCPVFKIDSVVVGEDITLDMCNIKISAPIVIVFNLHSPEWEMKISRRCIFDKGYCRIKIPHAIVADSIILSSLEIHFIERNEPIEKIRMFIGKIL